MNQPPPKKIKILGRIYERKLSAKARNVDEKSRVNPATKKGRGTEKERAGKEVKNRCFLQKRDSEGGSMGLAGGRDNWGTFHSSVAGGTHHMCNTH